MLWRATPAAINEALLCGFGKDVCAAQGVQQYVAAIDWTGVQRDRLAFTLWFNTSNLPTNPRQNKEKPERINAVRCNTQPIVTTAHHHQVSGLDTQTCGHNDNLNTVPAFKGYVGLHRCSTQQSTAGCAGHWEKGLRCHCWG